MVEDVHNIGYNYYPTLKAWNDNFNKNWDTIKDKYGGTCDGKFKRMWNFYLLSCAGMFACRHVQVYQVVLAKGGVPGGYESVR